jgi:hypothetical protein
MNDQVMSILLIGFAAVFLFIILQWRMFKSLFGFNDPQYSLARSKYDRLKGIHISYRLILILFIFISCSYLIIPQSKKWFYPITWLDNNYVNSIGFIILFIAFVLVLYAQLKLDKSLHLYYFNTSGEGNSQLVPKTEKNLLKSILLVYLGMFIVVSTIATAILLLASVIVYYQRSSSRKYRIKSPLPS